MVALILETFCWGFTVDDAWIVSRVAHHGMLSGIYSFNSGGPLTDAVTPLGFAHLLGLLGKLLGLQSQLELWTLARWIGVLSFLGSMAIVGFCLGREGRRSALWAGALSLLAVPSAAWAGAGLSTAMVGLLILLGGIFWEKGRTIGAGLALGWACGWRPELVPFVVTWCGCRLLSGGVEGGSKSHTLGLFAFLLVAGMPAGIRWLLFGRLIPLAAIAKSPEAQTAAFYAGVTMIWSGIGFLMLTRDHAFRRPGLWGIPWCAHLLAVFFAGGDWMPALRLTAPLFPLLVWSVGKELKPSRVFWAALIPGLGFPLALLWTQGSDFRAVAARRLALVTEGERLLSKAQVIAATDIGWVGLASTARIVDLGGVTDPRVAPLPGGHTSKHISPGLFSAREVDTWVIRALDRSYAPGMPLELIVPAYWVDARLLQRNADLGFEGIATIHLQGTQGQYVIARRTDAPISVALR